MMDSGLTFSAISQHVGDHVRWLGQNLSDSAAFASGACSRKLLTPPPLRCVVTGSAMLHQRGEGGGINREDPVGAVGVEEGSGTWGREGKR